MEKSWKIITSVDDVQKDPANMFVPRVPELSFNCSKRTLSTAEATQVSTTLYFLPCPQFQWELGFFSSFYFLGSFLVPTSSSGSFWAPPWAVQVLPLVLLLSTNNGVIIVIVISTCIIYSRIQGKVFHLEGLFPQPPSPFPHHHHRWWL